ncbi:hypothetical protein D3875_00230 [Deinococcus cavernae]|uniref:Uncharacterized protein n=1 Tax=Deinococcus cavernae TaxID=2320857 RepID=A0A418VJE0_9DEIO|nr:hypothetical protein [Deinococcus cavernae]RJF76176.1 hypothetical protein D3875_00230 [Deinococcus cavernae]
MTQKPQQQPQTQFYLVGKVPVEWTEESDGSVTVRAFNPLLGGFVTDARYYGAVQFEDMGRVQRIDRAAFEQAVRELQAAYSVPA